MTADHFYAVLRGHLRGSVASDATADDDFREIVRVIGPLLDDGVRKTEVRLVRKETSEFVRGEIVGFGTEFNFSEAEVILSRDDSSLSYRFVRGRSGRLAAFRPYRPTMSTRHLLPDEGTP